MRYLAVAILAVVLFVAGYLAADMRSPDADAQGGAWQFKSFEAWPPMVVFVEDLPANCQIDWEVMDSGLDVYLLYSCPD